MGRTPGDFVEDRSAPGTGPVQRDAVVPTYKKPSTAQLIIGTLGDTLSQWGGGQGSFLPGLARQRQAAAEAQQYQMQRADKFADFQREYDYKAAHPAAPADDVFTRDLVRAGIDPNSPEGAAKYRAKVENSTDRQVIVPLPNGTTYYGPQSGLTAAMGGGTPSRPPQAPVGKLTPLGVGGAPSQGARTFPVR